MHMIQERCIFLILDSCKGFPYTRPMPNPLPNSCRRFGRLSSVCIDHASHEAFFVARLGWLLIFLSFSLPGCDSKPPLQPTTAAPKPIESPQTQPPKEEDFQESLSNVSKLLADKKIQEAWDAVKKLSLVRPQDPQLLYLSALVLAAKDDLPGAIQTMPRKLSLQPAKPPSGQWP